MSLNDTDVGYVGGTWVCVLIIGRGYGPKTNQKTNIKKKFEHKTVLAQNTVHRETKCPRFLCA